MGVKFRLSDGSYKLFQPISQGPHVQRAGFSICRWPFAARRPIVRRPPLRQSRTPDHVKDLSQFTLEFYFNIRSVRSMTFTSKTRGDKSGLLEVTHGNPVQAAWPPFAAASSTLESGANSVWLSLNQCNQHQV